MSNSPYSFECLVLSGGGGKGAFGAGVANCLLKYRRLKAENSTMCYVGTSVGALNACLLAAGRANELSALWNEMTQSSVLGWLTNRWFRATWAFLSPCRWAMKALSWMRGRPYPFHIYSNRSLKKLIKRNIDALDFNTLCGEGHLIICATNYSKGCSEAFYVSSMLDKLKEQDSRKELEDQRLGHFRKIKDKDMLINALLASSAIPLIFPPVEIDGELFVDGGVSNNTPTGEAAQFLRHVKEYTQYPVGNVYCTHLDPIGTVTGKGDSLGFWNLLMRTYNIFFFVQSSQSLRSWHQISSNVKKNSEKVKEFRESVRQMSLSASQKEQILQQFSIRFGELKGSTTRLDLKLVEIQPAAPVGDTFDFSRRKAREAYQNGYNECAKTLCNTKLISPAERDEILKRLNDALAINAGGPD